MTSVTARGLKHTCAACETRYYDLGRLPATCPKCQQVETSVIRSAPARKIRGAGTGPAVAVTGSVLPGAKAKPLTKPAKT